VQVHQQRAGRVQLFERRRDVHSDCRRTDSPFRTEHGEDVSSPTSGTLHGKTCERGVQLVPGDGLRDTLAGTRAHGVDDERAVQARKNDEDTSRLVLTPDDRQLGWHRAPISRIHDDDVGLLHRRLGKRFEAVDFNGDDLGATSAKEFR
jgi:hypothetical protein